MNPEPRRPAIHDDPVDPPVIDLDAEPPVDDTAPVADTAESSGSARRWLVVPLIFIVGALLGVYIAGLRADAEAGGTVSLEFGGYDVDTWEPFAPGDPVSAGVHVLNTGTREIQILGMAVPGLTDVEIDHPDGDEEGHPVPPGQWVSIPFVGNAECTSVTGGPRNPRLHDTSSSVSITAGLDGRTTDVELAGPTSTRSLLATAVSIACESADVAQSVHFHLAPDSSSTPRDGRLHMQMAAYGNQATKDSELVAVRSRVPGFTVEADRLPVRLDATSVATFDLTWTVDCAVVAPSVGEDALIAEVATATGDTSETMTWLSSDVTFALGGLYAMTCSAEEATG